MTTLRKMKRALKGTALFGLIAALIVAAIVLAPLAFIWAVNTLAAAGGADFHLAHTPWNYFVSLLFLFLVRGGSGK